MARSRAAVLFPLLLILALRSQALAGETSLDGSTIPNLNPANLTPLDVIDRHQRLEQLRGYLRTQAPLWAPNFRDAIADPSSWMARTLKPLGNWLTPTLATGQDASEGLLPTIWHPVESLMDPPSSEQRQAFWLSPNYHHKGFLPFHDAMVMGVNLRESYGDGLVQMDIKPFWGQNWVSSNGYGGLEMGMDLGATANPWGRIAIRYIDGAGNLMDQGRGFDMKAHVRITGRLALDGGLRGDETTDLGNYVMVHCSLLRFGERPER